MTDRIIQTETLQGIADAIRAKKGTSEPIAVTAFASEIGNIESGGGSGGGAEFNIAYGDTEPTDTSKLWVKTNTPDSVNVMTKIVMGGGKIVPSVAALPTATSGIASAAVGTKVYLFGGYDGTYLNKIYVFDTETNTLNALSVTVPTASYLSTATAVGTKVYLFGGLKAGSTYLNKIYVFDTETSTITTSSTNLPSAAYGITSAAVGTKVYLFGGRNSTYLNTINVFDTETNTITTSSTKLPSAAYGITSAAVGTKVYLFGGIGSSNSLLNTINVFDTETITITTSSTNLPSAAYDITSAAVGTKVYLFGGKSDSSSISSIRVFDTETNTLMETGVNLPSKAREIASAAVGTKVYLFGGVLNSRLATINVFVLSMPLAANNLLIKTSIENNLFNLLSNVEIGVNSVYLGNADGEAEKVAAALYQDGAWTDI